MEVERTQDLILDAAEMLFADKGIDGTTVSPVHRLSGQLNKSAVHYHFGSKHGLVVAVIDRHRPVLAERRSSLLAVAGDDLVALVAALVRPATGQLDSVTGRRYLRILPELVSRTVAKQLARPIGAALTENLERIDGCIGHLEPAVRMTRLASAVAFVAETLGARARQIDLHEGDPALGHDEFVAQLEAMVVGLLIQPVAAKVDA